MYDIDKINDNFFHFDSFVKVVQKELNAKVYKLEDNLYYIIKNKYGLKILEVLPFSLYGNFPIDVDEKQIVEYINELEKHRVDIIRVNINPLYVKKKELSQIFTDNGYLKDEYNASILYLENTLELTRKKFNKSTKKHTNGTERNTRVSVFVTVEKKYYEKYHELYLESVKRWGIKEFYSKKLLVDLSNVENIKLWVGTLDGEMVSGMIVFYGKYGTFDWLAANLLEDEISKNRVALAIQYAVIKDAISKNLKYVNMGASNHNQGVDYFKQRWGTDYKTGYKLEKYSKKMKLLFFLIHEYKKISNNGFYNYICNKIGAVTKRLSNFYYDKTFVGTSNILNKDIAPLFDWSKTTQSIDYLYLKYSLKSFQIEYDDNVLDLGSGKGRILCYLDFSYEDIRIFGAEINSEACNISKELCSSKKNITISNTNILQDNFIVDNSINKIIMFNPFDVLTFGNFLDFIKTKVTYKLKFIYINIDKEQIELLKKSGIKYKLIELNKPCIGISDKVNAIGWINE